MNNVSKRKVSSEQIQQLFRFMTKKYVRYYDVQIELVDHFASAIETMWADNPTMSFEQGISKVYSQFPITGFNNLIQEKTKAIKCKIRRIFFTSLKEILSIEVALTCAALIYSLSYFFISIPYGHIVALCLVLLLWILGILVNLNFCKVHRENKNRFLVLEVSAAVLFSFIIFPISFLNHVIPLFKEVTTFPISILYSVIIVFLGIYIIIQYKTLQHIFEEWKNHYAFMA